MTRRRRAALGVGIVVGLFLIVQLSALALVQPFEQRGLQPVEDPSDPTNSLLYFGGILVATALMLLAIRLELNAIIRAVVIGSGAWLSLFVFRVIVPDPGLVTGVNVLAVAFAGLLALALYVHPEWYVVDGAGAIMGAAAAGLFGISFGILPALVLLVVLAVYDAISVYGTEHMLTLASGVMELRIPVVLVVPLTLSYSFREATMPDPTADAPDEEDVDDGVATEGASSGETGSGDVNSFGEAGSVEDGESAEGALERDALFVGLGDAVIPTVLVASAAFFAPAAVPTVAGVAVTALAAMVGTLAGLGVLLYLVMAGRAHAGLPLLNGGSILGYLVGAFASGLTVSQALGLSALA